MGSVARATIDPEQGSYEGVDATPKTEVEFDKAGHKVDLGTTPALWAPGDTIEYGASVGHG